MSKAMLTPESIESQAILELPERKLPLVTVVITNVLNNLSIEIPIKNNNVAVQVCAVVAALGSILTPDAALTCVVKQSQ